MIKQRILVIGCSFSRQYGDIDDPYTRWSWAEIVQQKLNDRGYSAKTYNTSQYCSSIFAQWHNLKFYLEQSNKKFDLAIVQLTTPGRMTYIENEMDYNHYLSKLEPGFNGVESYLEWPHDFSVSDYNSFKFNSRGFLHLNAGTATMGKRTSELKEAYLTNNLYSLPFSTPMQNDITLLVEKEMRRLCEHHGVPLIMFRWFRYPGNDDKEFWQQTADFCVSDDIPDFYDYTVDDGHHFGMRGNKKLVKEFIFPRAINTLGEP